MSLSEFETARIRRAVCAFLEKRRPPPHIRPKLDLAYRISGQSVELYEIRPKWRGAPGELHEIPYAKATFVRKSGVWRVFWRRADLKWHGYQPAPVVETIEDFCQLVDEDAHACFHG
jgi:hypothetical protein